MTDLSRATASQGDSSDLADAEGKWQGDASGSSTRGW
jgi:hypothetical protein